MKATVCKTHELANGELRQVKVGDTPVLLARSNDDFYALGAFCSHLGAPMAQGLMNDGRIVCPWHMASFEVQTGQQCEPPGLDGLTNYPLIIDGDDIVVDVPEGSSPHQTPKMATHNPETDGRVFVILGAGIAGQTAAEMLRQEGYEGRIIMITAEAEVPYRRTALSKKYLQSDSADAVPKLRSPEFFEAYGIEVWRDRAVTAVKPYEHSLTFEDGEVLTYHQLLVATGGKARRLDAPGVDLDNIFTLHKAEDAVQIVETAQAGKRAVVIGSSFIGMETAASLTQAGLSITVVSPEAVPFDKIFGSVVGHRLQVMHEENGVQFHLNARATGFEGNGAVEAVVLDNGDRIPADLVIVGIGIEPATGFLEAMKLHSGDGSVVVDAYLRAVESVFAAGDVARYPDPRSGSDIRIEHWRLAAQHGRIAARNMLGQAVPFKGVPFFWTNQFSMKLHYVGHADDWDDVIIHGDLEAGKFLAFYVESDQILAVLGNGYNQELIAIAEMMRLGELPSASVLQKDSVDWIAMLKQPVAA
jgi:NADPH-dependent 2,4-dienoyl-CoA reductase/sulfur reductase-like enzyme/nitrite reductase/ring-hydroxylating ferredoxin subunit